MKTRTRSSVEALLDYLNDKISPLLREDALVKYIPLVFLCDTEEDLRTVVEMDGVREALKLKMIGKEKNDGKARMLSPASGRAKASSRDSEITKAIISNLYGVKKIVPLNLGIWAHFDRLDSSALQSRFKLKDVFLQCSRETKDKYPKFYEDYTVHILSVPSFATDGDLKNLVKIYFERYVGIKDMWPLEDVDKTLINNIKNFKRSYPSLPLEILGFVIRYA